jgi:hypothetical protein
MMKLDSPAVAGRRVKLYGGKMTDANQSWFFLGFEQSYPAFTRLPRDDGT